MWETTLNQRNSRTRKETEGAKHYYSDTFEYVIILTNKAFSYADFQILNKNLIFCLTPR